MSTNRELIGIAGLVFLHYLQEYSFHKETGNTIVKFVNTFQEKTPTDITSLIQLYNDVSDPIAKQMANELLKVCIAADSKRLDRFNKMSPSITGLYQLLTNNIVSQKTSGKDISGTFITHPGDIVSFLKILFLSLFDDELYTEIEIFIKSIRPNYTPKDTIYLINKTIADNNIKPIILNMLIPQDKQFGSIVTQDLPKKIGLIQQILQLVPPS